VVIGGAFGIGLATARRFAAEGANVVIADLDDEQAAVLDLAGPDAVLLGTPTADSSHLAPGLCEGTPWTARIRPTVGDVITIHAQPCSSRIRHEDEKNASAILMRIRQTRR